MDEKQKNGPGEAVVTPKSIRLIQEHVQDSIGYIEINVPDNEGGISSYSDGTGFRVGDTYMMSAFHVFEGIISHLIEKITFKLSYTPEDNKGEMLKRLFGQSFDDVSIEEFHTRVESLLREFLDNNSYNIGLLLDRMKGIIDSAFLEEIANWKHCKVNFRQNGEFLVESKIVFGDKILDIIIVNLLTTEANQTYPTAFILDERYRQHGDIQIIRYIHRDPRLIIIDQECEVFQTNEQLRRSVGEAIEWWHENFPDYSEEYFRLQYENCWESIDDVTGCVILKSSESFTQGSSGSPVTYMLNNEGIVIVEMIYQGGFPPFYYEPNLPGCFREKAVHSKCFFGRGTTMKKISQVLKKFGKTDLKRKLFANKGIQESHQNAVLNGTRAEPDHYLHSPSELQLQQLSTHHVHVNEMNNKGESALHYVVLYDSGNKVEMANLLTENDAEVNATNVDRESLLHYTARFESQKNVALARIFIEKGALLHCENKEGESLLHYTTRYSQVYGIELTKLFLEHKAPVEVKNKFGESLLHYTAKYPNKHNYFLATIFVSKKDSKTDKKVKSFCTVL